MIIQNGQTCRGFVLCYGSMTSNEVFLAPNIADGVFNHFVYVYLGGALVGPEGNVTTRLDEGVLTDISEFAGSPIKYETYPEGAIWVAINPAPASKRYNGRLIKGATDETIIGNGKEMFILCLDKTIICESKELAPLKYTRVLNGDSKIVNVPEGAVAAVFTERE